LCQELQATHEWAEAAITLSTEQGLPFWLAWGTIMQGWALTAQGQGEEGIAQIRQGLAAYRATGAEGQRSYFLVLLADAYEKVGQPKEGLAVLTEVLAMVDNDGERMCEAEMYRLKGELLLQQFKVQGSEFKVENPQSAIRLPPPSGGNPQSDAEACFLKAIDIACQQQAKSWELRASTSLARLWQSQDKRAEAHKLLSEIYNWFTEGFDMKDLQEANALLDALS